MHRDAEVKRGQIAHLDHDRYNNKLDNLAFLCLPHHDEYDSTTSQSKGLTIMEVKAFRAELEEALDAALARPVTLSESPDVETEWEGLYRWEQENASAEIEIKIGINGVFQVSGLAFWGTQREAGPNLGYFDCVARLEDQRLVVEDPHFEIEIIKRHNGISVVEHKPSVGLNVTFSGAYQKVPEGAETVPQPPPLVFESEFWPEEGVPVFRAVKKELVLYSLPDGSSTVIGSQRVEPGAPIEFDAFRYRTIRPGKLRVLRPTQFVGRNLGQLLYVSKDTYYEGTGDHIALELETGDVLEYLQYRAEGTGFFRWRGLVLDADLPRSEPDGPFRTVVEPVAEGWIRVAGPKGKAWVRVDEAIQESGRDF